MNHLTRIVFVSAMIAISLSLYGCGGTPPPPAPPPPEVTESAPTQRDVTSFMEYTGTTAAVESVEIRAKVGGHLDKMLFEPGAKVKAGDVLFVIDPRPYQRKVELAKAALEAKRAALRIREIELKKYTPLASKEVVAEFKMDDLTASRDMAVADVEQAVANLETAKLDLDYAHVKSPVSGRVSRNLVDQGNLVGTSDNTLLANVVFDDKIYVYFNMSETDLLRLTRKSLKNGGNSKNPKAADAQKPVYMGLADEKGFPHTGTFDYTDIKVDSSTGTIQARAVFSNPDGILYPGMFARVKVPLETRSCLLVPDAAIMATQGGKQVLVCNADNIVEPKRVRTGQLVTDMRVIEEGLTPEDRVIVNGIQKARPGGKVTPVQATVNSNAVPAKSAAALHN
jgi:membrane fusion protein, multidrug efflux system